MIQLNQKFERMKNRNNKPEVPINCFFQGCYNPAYEAEIKKAKEKCYRYNQLCPTDFKAQQEILKELIGKMGKDTVITPPFWCDYGYNITLGDYFYSNHNMIITDGAKVTFGDHVFVAPNLRDAFNEMLAEHLITCLPNLIKDKQKGILP